MTTNSKTAPAATTTWWQMFWMIITQDAALGPYLKLWKGADPYLSLNVVKISVVAMIVGLVMCLLAHRLGDEHSYIYMIIGGVINFLGLFIGFANARCLSKTITSLKCIWNSKKFELLERGEFDRGMIKAIMTPTATYWAEQVVHLEVSGLDKLPKGHREKSSHKRKIDTYVSACLNMGLGRGILTHQELVKIVFSIAQGKY